jgi:hypothetical protein
MSLSGPGECSAYPPMGGPSHIVTQSLGGPTYVSIYGSQMQG